MGQFDSLLRCTLGGTHFQLEDYTAGTSPIVKDGTGRIGLEKRVTGTGWIEAATAADFATRLADVQGNLVVSGQTFTIYGLGSAVEYQITAAECVDGGPHAGFELLNQLDESQCYRKIRFAVTGKTANDFSGGTDPGISLYHEQVDTAASGLRRLTRTGEVNQANATSTFLSSILPAFRAAYPLPHYVVTHRHEYDEAKRKLKYTIIAEALATPLPEPGSVNVVDGRPSRRQSRDEQDRVTILYDFDLILDGVNYQPVLDLIRLPITTEGTIIRESFEFDATRELRLRASFEILRGDGTDLLNWQQSFEITDSGDLWEEVRHPHSEPFLVKADVGMRTLVQQGSAVGAERWPRPASPLYPDTFVAEPVVIHQYGNGVERITSWRYAMAVSDLSPFEMTAQRLSPLLRPIHPLLIT